jgi:glutathione S-transferase
MVVMPKLTLSYFPFANRAEPIRLAAAIGKVPFTNKSVAFQDFPQVKQHLPLGQLPILEIESPGKETVVISQAHAILRYFGKLGGKKI